MFEENNYPVLKAQGIPNRKVPILPIKHIHIEYEDELWI